MSELKARTARSIADEEEMLELGADCPIEPAQVYLKSEADKVIEAKDGVIAELKADITDLRDDKKSTDAILDERNAEIAELKLQIEFLKTTHDACGHCSKCAEGMGKVFDENLAELKADYKEACDRLQTANLIKDEENK